ncbi:MAG: MarR family transcriptional regulator [Devosia sp.]
MPEKSPLSPNLKDVLPLGYLIHEVAKLMKRRFEEEAREHDLTLPQFRILAELWRSPGTTQVGLANATDSDPMTVSGILDRLDKRGLLERYPNPEDSRAKLARITAAGEALVVEIRQTGLGIYSDSIAGVSKTEQKALTAALERIRDNLISMNNDIRPATAAQKEDA